MTETVSAAGRSQTALHATARAMNQSLVQEVLPPGKDEATSPRARNRNRHYVCHTGAGSLHLQWPAPDDDAPRDAVAAALALAACEPLLAALEDWLGLPLDPAPVDGSDIAGAPGLHAEVLDPRLAPPGTCIAMPWALVARRPAPTAALKAPALRWPALRFAVELARFDQRPVPDAAALPVPGALLLPPAFEPRWSLRLTEPRLGLAWRAEWSGPGSGLRLQGRPHVASAADGGPAPWRVCATAPLVLDAAEALGWNVPPLAGGNASAGDAATPAVAVPARALPWSAGASDEATDGAALFAPEATEPLLRGRIVPMLRGAGLWWDAAPAGQEGASWT